MSYLKEPFRLFFPLAMIYLFIGVGLWLLQPIAPEFYPVQWHRSLVMNGYFVCILYGFLFTAYPQFSQSPLITKTEFSLASLLTLAPVLVAGLTVPWPLGLTSICQALFLLYFIFSRITKLKANPPYSFIFILVALLLWIYSEVSSLATGEPEALWLFYEASTLAFIIAVGARLIPGLLGHQQIVDYQRSLYEKPEPYYKVVPKGFYLMAIVYFLSAMPWQKDLGFLRVAILTTIALSYWRIFTLPTTRTSFSWSVWLCCWGIILAQYAKLFFLEFGIHILHAHFILAIVLLTLLVITRVSNAHLLKIKDLEKKKTLLVITFLLFLTAATRVSAPMLPASYENHLAYSAFVLLLSFIIWFFLLFNKKSSKLSN